MDRFPDCGDAGHDYIDHLVEVAPVHRDVQAMLGIVPIEQVLRIREIAVQAGLERLADACGDEIRRRSVPHNLRRIP